MGVETFIPGSHWTPERATEARRRMVVRYESPAFGETIAQLETGDRDSALDAAQKQLRAAADARLGARISKDDVLYRRGAAADVPRIVELMVLNDLPPMFIEEFLEGFCIAEAAGDVVGCGGAELYLGAAVLRSIAVDARARGLGVGRRIAELLIEDARRSGATDIYLFTEQAAPFWRHLGFVDVPFEAWKDGPREGWQYRFLDGHRGLFDVHTMWRRA